MSHTWWWPLPFRMRPCWMSLRCAFHRHHTCSAAPVWAQSFQSLFVGADLLLLILTIVVAMKLYKTWKIIGDSRLALQRWKEMKHHILLMKKKLWSDSKKFFFLGCCLCAVPISTNEIHFEMPLHWKERWEVKITCLRLNLFMCSCLEFFDSALTLGCWWASQSLHLCVVQSSWWSCAELANCQEKSPLKVLINNF